MSSNFVVVAVAIVLKTFAGDIAVVVDANGDDNLDDDDDNVDDVIMIDSFVIGHQYHKNDVMMIGMLEVAAEVVVSDVAPDFVDFYAAFDLPNTFRADFPISFRYLPPYVQL